MYFIYILECADGSLYTGITNDLERRFEQHKAGKGGHYTSAKKARTMVYTEKCPDKSAALKREAQIKKLTRKQKLQLATSAQSPSMNIIVAVNDTMQKGYRYTLTEPVGKKFDPRFKPELTPKQMLALGVFGGVYMRDCLKEFPKYWFTRAKFQKEGVYEHDAKLNYFKVNASQPLSVWREKGWIHADDPRGWFQWYCRYYMGRRGSDDERQIKRWIAIRRHIAQIKKNCRTGDLACHAKQRQAVLHWAYDSRKL